MPSQSTWIFPVISVVLLVCFLIYDKRKVKIKRQSRETLEEAATTRQEIVLNELAFLGNLVDDTSLSASELQAKAAASFTILEANNVDGRYTKTIDDLKQYVASKTDEKASDYRDKSIEQDPK